VFILITGHLRQQTERKPDNAAIETCPSSHLGLEATNEAGSAAVKGRRAEDRHAQAGPAATAREKAGAPRAGRNGVPPAMREKRRLAFEFLNGHILEAVPLSYGFYAVEVQLAEGERLVVFKHALKLIRRLPS
jgi:hypothetical protein